MSDYPDERGVFLRVARELLAEKTLVRWYKKNVAILRAQEYAAMPLEELPPVVAALAGSMEVTRPPAGQRPVPAPASASKVSFCCPECRARAGGKPGLSLICGKCFDERGDVVLEINAVSLQDKDRWVSANRERRPAIV